jgi:enoyl-CoA hydratase
MDYENVIVETSGPVATIMLNRPDKLNALSAELLRDLDQALLDLNPGDAIRVIRIKASGRIFSSGYDLDKQALRSVRRAGVGIRAADSLGAVPAAQLGQSTIALDREQLRSRIERWQWMWNYRKPIIAQVHGMCLSGGLDLIGVCDIIYAAEGTRFGHPASRVLGIPLTLGMLPIRIGAAQTKRLLFTGDTIDAAEACRLGLATEVVAADQLDDHTMAFCQRVALTPLDALTVHKHVTNRWLEQMGVRASMLAGAEFDAIYHLTPATAEFSKIAAEQGLASALGWRDEPFES